MSFRRLTIARGGRVVNSGKGRLWEGEIAGPQPCANAPDQAPPKLRWLNAREVRRGERDGATGTFSGRVLTEEELRGVYGTLFVPRLMERQERQRIEVAEWLVEPGDEVTKG